VDDGGAECVWLGEATLGKTDGSNGSQFNDPTGAGWRADGGSSSDHTGSFQSQGRKRKLRRTMKRRIWMSLVLVGVFLFILRKTINRPEQDVESRHLASKEKSNPYLSDHGPGHQDPHPLVAKATQAKPTFDEEQARLENWKRNFPFKPRYHPTLRHDPTIYDANDASTWDAPDDHEASIKHAGYRRTVVNHGYLADFYESPLRYSKEFEQLYHLLGEFDRNDNAINVAKIFRHVVEYHKAAQHDPNDLVTKTIPTYDEETKQHGIKHVPLNGTTTWGDDMESYREGIAFVLYQESQWPSKPQMKAERAWELADHIIKTMYSDTLLSISRGDLFAYSIDHQESLKPGDSLLIPKEGYVEAYEEYIRETHRPVLVNNMEVLPEVLILGEDGKFYDKATGEVFMPGMEPIIVEPGQKPNFH